MKLYSGPMSLFTAKVRVILSEKEIPYELISVPFNRDHGYEPKHPEVLARNPKAQVPVLVDGDTTVIDSTLIGEYLEETHPTPALMPRDAVGRARCRHWEMSSDEILFPQVWTLIEEVFYQQEAGARDAARMTEARAGIARYAAELDGELVGRAYLCGDFGLADIAHALTLFFAAGLGAPIDAAHTELSGWMARLAARPSIQTEITEMTVASQKLGLQASPPS